MAWQPLVSMTKVLNHENTWSFLELIDAPQWVDLSLEESLGGKEGSDSWFETSHRHHTISLAGLNSSALWLRVDQSKQVKEIVVSNKRNTQHQKVACQVNGTENVRQFNKPVCFLQRHMTAIQVQCGSSKHIDRACISDPESNGKFKKHSSSSDISSVDSSLQACSIESDKFSLKTPRSRDSYRPVGSPKNRSFSSAPHSAAEPAMRYSTDSGVATTSTCERDWQSSGDRESSAQSVVTVASSNCQEEIDEGFTRMCDIKKAGGNFEERTMRCTGGSSTMNKNLLHCRQNALGARKHCVSGREKRLERSVSGSGSSTRKQGYLGKENVPPKVKPGNRQAAKCLDISAPLTISSSVMANGKVNALRASSKFPFKTSVPEHLGGAQRRKVSVTKELPLAHGVPNKSEQDLIALVAQVAQAQLLLLNSLFPVAF